MTRHPLRVKSRMQLTLKEISPGMLPLRSVVFSVTLVILCLGILLSSRADTNAQTPLQVFAAASLTDAFLALGEDFERAHPQIDLLFNFAGSSTLAAQLLQGAQADVFASADEQQMVRVRSAGFTKPASTFARNSLILALPVDNPAGLESFEDLADPGVRLVMAAPGVPIRGYSEELLGRLALLYDFSKMDVLANVVSEESNVRQILFRVAHGSADAAFVYSSDITPELAGSVRTLPVPEIANVSARYPVAVVSDTSWPQQARAFIDFLLSPAGQQGLLRNGFESSVQGTKLPLPCNCSATG